MSNSMVSTVLQIEREAEAHLEKARKDAETILADAKIQRAAAARAYDEDIKKEIAALETRAASERAKKMAEVNAAGEAALAKVTNISDAAFDNGVKYLLDALSGR